MTDFTKVASKMSPPLNDYSLVVLDSGLVTLT